VSADLGVDMKILVADIGGTKSWLAIIDANAGLPTQTLFEQQYPSTAYTSLKMLLEQFLSDAPSSAHDIEQMALGLPGVLSDQPFVLTNLAWKIDKAALIQQFKLEHILFLNDFAAVAAGVSTLIIDDYLVLNQGIALDNGVRVVTGAGTGLGQAWLLSHADTHTHFATEGGHIDFAPTNDKLWGLHQFLAAKYGHVSYERILSGEGLLQLYHFCTQSKTGLKEAAEVSALAAENDPAAVEALALFMLVYGAFIGNLALLYRPQAIYIAGGIGAKLQQQMQSKQFIESALHKGRMRHLVEQTPIYLVTNQRLGLQGVIQTSLGMIGKR